MTPAAPGGAGRWVLTLEDFPRARWAVSRSKTADIARVLSPNGRYGWQVRARATKWVHWMVWAVVRLHAVPPWPAPVRLRLTYVRPVQRDRDQDNWTSGLTKAVLDGLVKAGVLEGDDLARLSLDDVRIVVEPKRRALIIERLEAE